jgi:hypothetical protein
MVLGLGVEGVAPKLRVVVATGKQKATILIKVGGGVVFLILSKAYPSTSSYFNRY